MFQRFFWLNSVAWFVGQHLIHLGDEELVVSLRVVRFAGWELVLLSCARRDYFGQRLDWICSVLGTSLSPSSFIVAVPIPRRTPQPRAVLARSRLSRCQEVTTHAVVFRVGFRRRLYLYLAARAKKNRPRAGDRAGASSLCPLPCTSNNELMAKYTS